MGTTSGSPETEPVSNPSRISSLSRFITRGFVPEAVLYSFLGRFTR